MKVQAVYEHPDSPQFGTHWMSQAISFANVKLTNKNQNKNEVVLNSLHKYETRLQIIKLEANSSKENIVKTIEFPVTQFIAVTAYQNVELTKLKISYNPSAKAFKDEYKHAKQQQVEQQQVQQLQQQVQKLQQNRHVPQHQQQVEQQQQIQYPQMKQELQQQHMQSQHQNRPQQVQQVLQPKVTYGHGGYQTNNQPGFVRFPNSNMGHYVHHHVYHGTTPNAAYHGGASNVAHPRVAPNNGYYGGAYNGGGTNTGYHGVAPNPANHEGASNVAYNGGGANIGYRGVDPNPVCHRGASNGAYNGEATNPVNNGGAFNVAYNGGGADAGYHGVDPDTAYLGGASNVAYNGGAMINGYHGVAPNPAHYGGASNPDYHRLASNVANGGTSNTYYHGGPSNTDFHGVAPKIDYHGGAPFSGGVSPKKIPASSSTATASTILELRSPSLMQTPLPITPPNDHRFNQGPNLNANTTTSTPILRQTSTVLELRTPALITPPKELLNDELADLLNDFEDFVQTSEENKENLQQPIDAIDFDFN